MGSVFGVPGTSPHLHVLAESPATAGEAGAAEHLLVPGTASHSRGVPGEPRACRPHRAAVQLLICNGAGTVSP